jgi:hypothetical protein
MSAAAKMLEHARAAGVRLEARGGRLAYDAPCDVSPALLTRLREHKAELVGLLQGEQRELLDAPADPDARASCLSGLIGTLAPCRVPYRWPAATWPQLVADAAGFCRDRAEQAFLLGWPTWALFGCHRRAPWGRIQGMGLVLLLRGDEIAALTATEAVIQTSTGAYQTYRRKPADPLHPAERCLVWELETPAGEPAKANRKSA